MSIVKSFSVGNGDMFYIRHGSDNFSVIDCCLDDDTKDGIIAEIKEKSRDRGISRFISTHPDEDHIQGLKELNENWPILNFYCVKNEATKEKATESFEEYCKLRDDVGKAFYIYKYCSRKWMNRQSDESDEEEHGSAGINILWPDRENIDYQDALSKVKAGESPNNISPVILYSCGVKFMWMGDLETDFLEKVKDEIKFEEIDILFAPHHGRDSGKLPADVLEKLSPKIVVVGEAPSEKLNYYAGYDTITQNTAGDITFVVNDNEVDVYVSNENYSVDYLKKKGREKGTSGMGYYIGSLEK